MMLSSNEAEKGVILLDSISKSGNSQATFMLSRLYFESKKSEEALEQPDFVLNARQKANLSPNNFAAHLLLEKAVKQDSANYEALYEMALDYIGGTSRTEAVERNLGKAKMLLERALTAAEDKGDADYQQKISKVIDTYYM